MHSHDSRPPLIVILGPTAVGKTEISIQVAKRLNGEIVSADSRLLYRGMNVGTAKPSIKERSQVPHHLIDVAKIDETWSLAKFQKAAYQAIDEIYKKEKLPFLVGGTGQYVRAVTEGWIVPKQKPDPRFRKVLENWTEEIGPRALHERLSVLDPKAASKIDYRNIRRTIRALEVIFHTGRRFSEQRKRGKPRYRLLQIGLLRSRQELYKRIDTRLERMIESGFAEEVKTLLAQGFSTDLPSLSAIGYREMGQYVKGEMTLEEAITLIKRNTRQFVRRQSNWFREDDPDIHWFRVVPDTVDRIERLILFFLGGNLELG